MLKCAGGGPCPSDPRGSPRHPSAAKAKGQPQLTEPQFPSGMWPLPPGPAWGFSDAAEPKRSFQTVPQKAPRSPPRCAAALAQRCGARSSPKGKK